MGLIKRLKQITLSRIEAFLQTVEDPEVIYPRLVTEVEGHVAVAAGAEAKALSAVRSAQKKCDEAAGRVSRLQRAAELALERADEGLAREALAAQVEAEKDAGCFKAELDRAESARRQAREVRQQLEDELENLRARKDEIVTRARMAKSQRHIHAVPPASGSILEQAAALERRLMDDEARVDIQRELSARTTGTASIEARLIALERQSEIELRLAALKNMKPPT